MPSRQPTQLPDFSSLRISLVQSQMQTKNPALWQVIDTLIKWLEQLRTIQNDAFTEAVPDISGLVAIVIALTQAEYLTWSDQLLVLPNSRNLLAGTGITFDDSIDGERTIDAVGGSGGGYVPVVTGEEPLGWVSDGAGQPILVGYEA